MAIKLATPADPRDRDPLASAIARHPLTPKGRAIVERIRAASDPARKVRGGGSITVRYPCALMRRVMHLESRGFEAPVACALDDNPQTKEFYEQPCRLEIPIRAEQALRATKIPVWPDFFAIIEDPDSPSGLWLGFIGAKPTTRMRELAAEAPERYERGDDGRWHDVLFEMYVRTTFGLDARIDTDAEVSATLARNITYLADYGLGDTPVDPQLGDAVLELVSRQPGLSGTALIEGCAGLTRDTLNQLAWDLKLWFPRDRELIKDLDRVHFYPSAEFGRAVVALPPTRAVEIGVFNIAPDATFRWHDHLYQIEHLGEDARVYALRDDGETKRFKRRALEQLFERGEIQPQAEPLNVAAAMNGMSLNAKMRFVERSQDLQRSLAKGRAVGRGARKWLPNYKRLELTDGSGIWALRPRFANCGRRGDVPGFRVDHVDRDLAISVIRDEFLTKEQRRIVVAYGIYRKRFEEEIAHTKPGATPMSRKTFTKIIDRCFPAEEIARNRKGWKAANQAKLRGPLAGGRIDAGLPTAGDRSFERVHIDHTLLDLWVVDSVTRKPLDRVWLTLAVDAFSGVCLAYDLSLEEPSKRLPMQILRKLVRQHHRLPTTIITDNGADFLTIYFQTFLSAYSVRHEYRRPGTPRDGSPVEGFIGRLNRVIHALVGNARPAKEPRELDKDFAPEKHAIWTLQALDQELLPGAIKTLNDEGHPTKRLARSAVFAQSLAEHGLRPGRRIAYDAAFLAFSAIPRKLPIQVGRDGIEVGPRKIAYWCDAFSDPSVQGTTVAVRDEPFDVSRKYALVGNRWHLCRTERFRAELENRTEVEIEAASKELAVTLAREPEMHEVIAFLCQTKTVEARLAEEQRAARRRQLVHEVTRDDTDNAEADEATEDEDRDEVDTASDETSADSRTCW